MGGVYTGPDLATAQRLVTESATRGDSVDVLGSTDEGYIPPDVPAYLASVLSTLGYRTISHLPPTASVAGPMLARFPISNHGDWVSDYPEPSSYIPTLLGCNGSNNHRLFCDPATDRDMNRAGSLELSVPRAADAIWTSIDRALTD